MKVHSIKNNSYKQNVISARQCKTEKEKTSKKKLYQSCVAGIAFASCVISLILYKNRRTTLDSDFKQSIIQSLRSEGINITKASLNSIVGPEEFKQLIKKFKPSHYKAGLQISNACMQLEQFYANAINGDFRVSLHTHSNFSDGKATAEEFLECANKYANKVAKLNKNDGLPPFTIALTDHDSVEGTKKIIKLITKNPEKYKNLKFVAGCEFSVNNNGIYHDITGLALNPFEQNLNTVLNELRTNRIRSLQGFLNSEQKNNPTKITIKELADYEKEYYKSKGKEGKCTIENASGVVFIRHGIKYFSKITGTDINKKALETLGHNDILSIEKVVNTINQNGGFASLTHPLKSFWSYIGDSELLKLKQMGVRGIEVYHQYTPSKIITIGEKTAYGKANADKALKELTEKYENFAKQNDMFLSGGTDCHEKQIFSREPKIPQDLLENKILN